MKGTTITIMNDLYARYPALASCKSSIASALATLTDTFANGHKLLICGNGGSAADAEHMVGELMKGFKLPRKLPQELQAKLLHTCPDCADYLVKNLQQALPACSLVSQTALSTAFSNDQSPDLAFAQQVLGYGQAGDCLLGITTSGNSQNVIYAAQIARTLGMKVIGLTGNRYGAIVKLSDTAIEVPEKETFKIQELHLPVYHALCAALENEFFTE